MIRRILNIFALFALMVSSAMAQTFSVSSDYSDNSVLAEPGGWTEVHINLEGAEEMTALQFCVSLPECVTLDRDWPIHLGNATNGHTLNVSTLDSGDLLVVIYSLHSATFSDGTLLSFTVTAGEEATSAQGNLHTIRTATLDAMSHECDDVVFSAAVVNEEPVEPEAKYYWYVGVTDPRTLTPGNVGNEVLDQWTEFTTEKESPVSVSKQDPEYNDHIWYIAAPYDWKYTLYNATGAASNEAGYAMSEATIDGVRYKIWKSKQEQWQVVGQLTITNHVPITAITLSHTAITMKEGEQLEVTATVTPENATNRMLSWVSSDESVADYYNGKVYAFAPGTATITVTDTDFYGNKASTSFTVTVEAAAVEPEAKYYWYAGTTMPDAVDPSTWEVSSTDAGFTATVELADGDNYLVIPNDWVYTAIEPSTNLPFEWNAWVKPADKVKIPGYTIKKAGNMVATEVEVTFSKAEGYYWYSGSMMQYGVDVNSWGCSTTDAEFTADMTIYEGNNYLIIPDSWDYTMVESSTGLPFDWKPFIIEEDKTTIAGYVIVKVSDMTTGFVRITFTKKEENPTPETSYYWYVGTTEPTELNGEVANAETDKWVEIGTEMPSYIKVETANKYGYWYMLMPTSLGFKPHDSVGDTDESALWTSSESSIPGYTLWSRKDKTLKLGTILKKEGNLPYVESSSYWYMGHTDPSSATEISPIVVYNWASPYDSWEEIVNSSEKIEVNKQPADWDFDSFTALWYVAMPASSGYTPQDADLWETSTATIAGKDYIVYKSEGKVWELNTAFLPEGYVEEEPVEPEPEGLLTGKNYRVKNVTTGLYLQVEGNNTNMKLQNRADGVELSQVFQLEDAGEGMYYIKAADGDNNYYAHASGWNFNATTNADNKTPFTIALVEGETQVYTLHQSVSDYKGLVGADAAEAGAAIYCNKGVDNNGKWAFEPLTEEENAAYTSTLTATARQAVEDAIARGEAVVANRSAVLTAEETAAINNAVQAAKEGKDAAADVTALKALSDAIHTAVDEAIYVWSIDEVSNEVCYAVSTEDRGAWYAQAANLTSTTKAGVAVDVTDKQQFAFVQSPETGALYLYSVSEEKFVKAEGGYTTLTEAPVQTITILNGTRSAAFPWVVALNAEDGQKQMGISNGYDPAVITHYNDLGDGGNTVRIVKVAAFDASAALAAIEVLETGIEQLTNDNGQWTIYDLTGRKVENPAKGIYIVGGKKTVIK